MVAFLSQMSLAANLSRLANVSSVILRTSIEEDGQSPASDIGTLVASEADRIEAQRIVKTEVFPPKGRVLVS